MVWTLVEPGVAIVAASLVTIRPLLRKMRLKGFESTAPTEVAGARSGTNRSRSKRPVDQPGLMPGFGPEEVTLVDLEAGIKSRDSVLVKHKGTRQRSEDGYRQPGLASQGNPEPNTKLGSDSGIRPPSGTRSEILLIEGDRMLDRWSGTRLGSPSEMSYDTDALDSLEGHNK